MCVCVCVCVRACVRACVCHLCISDRQHNVMLMTDPLTAWFIQSRLYYLIPDSATNLRAARGHRSTSTSQGPHLFPIIQYLWWSRTFGKHNHKPLQHKPEKLKYKSAYLYLHFCSAATLRRKMTNKVRPGPHGSCSAPIIHFFLPSLGRKHHPAEATMAKKLLKLWLFDDREDPEEGEMPEGTIWGSRPGEKGLSSGWEGHLNGVWRESKQIKVWEQKHWPWCPLSWALFRLPSLGWKERERAICQMGQTLVRQTSDHLSHFDSAVSTHLRTGSKCWTCLLEYYRSWRKPFLVLMFCVNLET